MRRTCSIVVLVLVGITAVPTAAQARPRRDPDAAGATDLDPWGGPSASAAGPASRGGTLLDLDDPWIGVPWRPSIARDPVEQTPFDPTDIWLPMSSRPRVARSAIVLDWSDPWGAATEAP